MTLRIKKTATIATLVMGLIAVSATSMAHLPKYEGERVRNGNHFTTDGFAWPVRGECDINAVGPVDEDAGSANFFLGPDNTPPNFFCAFTSQDDWSFDFPANILEATLTPAPDPRTLGQPIEEGYIPCSPVNPDPFQCPREFVDPTNPMNVVKLPGECVDLGQPDDPAASADPDGVYHCAVLPYSPRPRTSSVLFSTLTGSHDVDWAIYRYDPVFEETPIVGAPQVPACKENLNSFVSFAYAGPLGMVDARTGEELFVPLEEAGSLPHEIISDLPEGYGIRVKRPTSYRPSMTEPRIAYASGFAQNAWLLAEDSVKDCIDDFEKCLADETGEFSKHYIYNDIFFVDEDQHVDLYLMWWVDKTRGANWWWSYFFGDNLIDVSITTGVIDQFLVGDYMNIAVTGPFSANGRYIHGRCTDPLPSGAVEITIETN